MESFIANAIDGEYVREWLVLGPFFPDDLETDFLADKSGEANIQPQEGDTVITSDGRTLTWKLYKSKEDIVDLLDAVGDHEHATAYAFCVLQSETKCDAEILLGSDDGVAVWINGKQVHLFSGDRPLSLDQDVFWTTLNSGDNRCLVKVSNIARYWAFAMRRPAPVGNRAALSGVVRDEAGKPVPNVYVRLKQDENEIAQVLTDEQGRYSIIIHEVHGKYDLYADTFKIDDTPLGPLIDAGEVGGQQLGIVFERGERRSIDLTLENAVSIEGTLLMLDDITPHAGIPVQAIHDGKVFDTVLSDEKGNYRFINLKPEQYQLRCQVLAGYIYYGEEKARRPEGQKARKTLSLRVEHGETLRNIDFRFPPFKKGVWRHYGSLDGLAYDIVHKIYMDSDGMMWLATADGASRYDGKEFVNLTMKDGLLDPNVRAIHQSPDGMMWFGAGRDGVFRYDGNEFVNLTEEDGLVLNNIICSYCDPEGVEWFGSWGGGVSRYDGSEFVNFTLEDGAIEDSRKIYGYPDGTVWVTGWGSGISRYDGERFTYFATPEELEEALESGHKLDRPASDSLIWARFQDRVCFYDGREFVNFPLKDGIQSDFILNSTQRDPDGVAWFSLWALCDVGLCRYDGNSLVNFTTQDGLLCNAIYDVHIDTDGVLWIASGTVVDISHRGGLSRYDSKGFINFTTQDGLPDNIIRAIEIDRNGAIWIGTGSLLRNGLSCYDGKEFVTFDADTHEGLIGDYIDVIHCDPNGMMWFAARRRVPGPDGISRYDGKKFEIITQIKNKVEAIHSIPNGPVWIATRDGNIFRYDGITFHRFTKYRELEDVSISTIYCAPDGIVWFGTEESGIYRYDEQNEKLDNFTSEKDGLASNTVSAMCSDSKGGVWFATVRMMAIYHSNGTGVSYYNGKEFINFTTDDGLASDTINAIHCGSDGKTWFGTDQLGVSGYDGTAWTTLDTRDGLAGNRVTSICQDEEGYLWFGTIDGLTRYCPGKSRPKALIVSVTTDQTYTDPSSIPAFTAGNRVTIEYSSIDFKTIPEKRQYRCRVKGVDSDWRKPTRSDTFDFIFDELGTYTFQVQSIDHDLNYSEPASVKLEVIPDPRNHRIIQLEEHIHQQELAELERVHGELEDARQIQQSLLPEKPPEVEGFEIAGTSLPAREVSGDFYTYLSFGDNAGIVLADVTGKSVKAAMVAAMTSGMLNEAINAQEDLWDSPVNILSRLNTGLHLHLIRGMYTAMSLGIIQPEQKRLTFSNAGMPYPIVKRGDEVWELEVNGMPLGLIGGAEYDDMSIDLESGDFVIFCSDGVIEAMDESEEMYQTERLLESVQKADSDLSAQSMMDWVLKDVTEFAGDVEPADDTTIVVIRCA